MTDFPTLAELTAEEEELQLSRFTNDDAWALGSALVARGQAERLPIAIEVSRHSHQLFHAALTGATPDNDAWIARKARVVLTTSLVAEDTPADSVDLLASEGGRHFRVRTPRLDLSVNGAGDAIAALFLAHLLRTGDAGQALSGAAASVFGLLARTEAAGSREILLVEAQEELVTPTRVFEVDEV